ncbi:hypothetical protein J6590_031156 [Homalodisca vitripennis]|nr:hypothetical protein J6590_031156 [Homalodisca vitripennis]
MPTILDHSKGVQDGITTLSSQYAAPDCLILSVLVGLCEDLIKQNKGESRYSTRSMALIHLSRMLSRIYLLPSKIEGGVRRTAFLLPPLKVSSPRQYESCLPRPVPAAALARCAHLSPALRSLSRRDPRCDSECARVSVSASVYTPNLSPTAPSTHWYVTSTLLCTIVAFNRSSGLR